MVALRRSFRSKRRDLTRFYDTIRLMFKKNSQEPEADSPTFTINVVPMLSDWPERRYVAYVVSQHRSHVPYGERFEGDTPEEAHDSALAAMQWYLAEGNRVSTTYDLGLRVVSSSS